VIAGAFGGVGKGTAEIADAKKLRANAFTCFSNCFSNKA
jgi:hypothetical protein